MESHEKTEPRDIRGVSQTHSGPRFGQSCPGTWEHTIWKQEDALTRYVEAHVLSAWRPTIQTCRRPHILGIGRPQSEDQLPSYPRETDLRPYYKYPKTSRYKLAEIIVIKTFIQIIQRTNLNIGVRPTGTPSKPPYRAHYFAGKV